MQSSAAIPILLYLKEQKIKDLNNSSKLNNNILRNKTTQQEQNKNIFREIEGAQQPFSWAESEVLVGRDRPDWITDEVVVKPTT